MMTTNCRNLQYLLWSCQRRDIYGIALWVTLRFQKVLESFRPSSRCLFTLYSGSACFSPLAVHTSLCGGHSFTYLSTSGWFSFENRCCLLLMWDTRTKVQAFCSPFSSLNITHTHFHQSSPSNSILRNSKLVAKQTIHPSYQKKTTQFEGTHKTCQPLGQHCSLHYKPCVLSVPLTAQTTQTLTKKPCGRRFCLLLLLQASEEATACSRLSHGVITDLWTVAVWNKELSEQSAVSAA